MLKTFVKSKLHRVSVTDASLHYMGSVTIGHELMDAAGIKHYELVHINNLSNAAHWETYAIPGATGQIILNGPPSRLFQKGDKVVIFSTIMLSPSESHEHFTVFVDDNNVVTDIMKDTIVY